MDTPGAHASYQHNRPSAQSATAATMGQPDLEAPAPPQTVERDPNERLQEVLDYLSMSYDFSKGWNGTAVFDVPESPVNPNIVFWVRCNPKDATTPVTTGYGMPPDKRYDVYTTLSRDDFFYLYSGRAGPGAVSSMVLTGRIKVKWFKFDKLHSFASSFVYTTPQWIQFYTRYANGVNGFQIEADRLMQTQWQKAAADASGDFVVDQRGNIVPAASIADAALLTSLRARGQELLGADEAGKEAQVHASVQETEETQASADAKDEQPAPVEAIPSDPSAAADTDTGPVLQGEQAQGAAAEESSAATDQPDLVSAQEPVAVEPSADVQASASESSSSSADTAMVVAVAGSAVSEAARDASTTGDESQDMQASTSTSDAISDSAPAAPGADQASIEVSAPNEAQGDSLSTVEPEPQELAEAATDIPALVASEQSSSDGSPLVPAIVSSAASSSSSIPDLRLSEEALAVEETQARLDMALMLPHLASQVDMTEKELQAAGLQVVSLPPSLASAPMTAMRVVSVSQAAEPLLQSASQKQAEMVLLESTLTQVRAAIDYIQPGSEAMQASTASGSAVSASAPANGGFFDSALGYIGGALQGMGERISGEAEKKEKRVQQLRREEDTLLSRRDKLRRDVDSSLSKAEHAISSVYRAQAGGMVLALVAASGYMGFAPGPSTDPITAASSALASRLVLRSVLSSRSAGECGRGQFQGGSVGPLAQGIPSWVQRALSDTAARQASMRVSTNSPPAALARITELFALGETQPTEVAGGSLSASPAAQTREAYMPSQGVIELPDMSKQALQAVTQVWLEGQERMYAVEDSRGQGSTSRAGGSQGPGTGSVSGKGLKGHNLSPEAALEKRLAGLRSLSSLGVDNGARFGSRAAASAVGEHHPQTAVGASTGALGNVLGSIVDRLPSILETSRTEGVAPGQIDSLAGPMPVLPSSIAVHPSRTLTPPPPGSDLLEEDSMANGGAAVARHVAALAKSWKHTFPGCHPLSSMATLVQRGVGALTMRTLGLGMGTQGFATLGLHHLPHTPVMWTPAGLPAFFPPWMSQQSIGESKDAPVYVSSATATVLSRLRPAPVRGGVWSMEPEHVETAAWCLGASLHPFGKSPVCYDAVEHVNVEQGSPGSGAGNGMSLHPLWRPKRLLSCQPAERGQRKEKGLVSAESFGAGGSLSSAALQDASSSDQLRTVLSPWHLKTKATLPTVYNGLGSDVYARTAAERLRLLYEDTIAATLQVAAAADAAAPPVRRRRSMSALEAERLHWPDDTLQAARPPQGILDEVRAGKAVQDVVRKFRDMRILRVYAKSNPLSIYTADSEAELTRHDAPLGSQEATGATSDARTP